MKQLWQAFIARLVYWLTPKPPVMPPAPIVKAPEPSLSLGKCECGHNRSSHIGGKGYCTMAWPPSENWPNGSHCSCTVFILNDDDDDEEEEPEAPSPAELEKLYQK